MTQIFDPAVGTAIPVTVIQAGPCHVLQVRTNERDGYEAVQLGYLDKPRRLASRALRGHVAKLDSKRQKRRGAAGIEAAPKADCEPKRFVRELRGPVEGYQVGQEIKVDLFDGTTAVDVTGVSKGRGTQGAMKRHNFKGQGASHGNHKKHRSPGSIGACATPSRVFKGTRMAGRMGGHQVTTLNLEVVQADPERELILIKGAVPGPRGGMVVLRDAVKAPLVKGGKVG